MDKTDIVAAARELGTYDDATVPAGCNRVAPDHPETRGDPAAVRRAEPDDLFDLAERAAETVTVAESTPATE
ncbi:MAG: tRNA 4-thiouridine(8) synthase ThiI, partial [Halorhabdus sp.]